MVHILMADCTIPLYTSEIYLSCHTLAAFYGKEYFRVGRNGDLVLDNVVAGANLSTHLRVPVLDIPLQSIR